MAKTIEIEIYGHRYTIKGEADEDYVKRLATYVDEQMRGLAQGMKTATLSKLALLAAINIAHQLFQSEQARQQGEVDVERRALCLMESIEEQLQPARGR
ncbi:MAG: cell division protein ZapA [Nitrospirota bacterium]